MRRRQFLAGALGATAGLFLPAAGVQSAPGRVPMTKLNNGRSIPLVGLGTYSLKGQICIDAVYGAIRLGYRLVNTAHMYGNEREVGMAVRKAVADGIVSREEVIVATKLYPSQYAKPASAIEESLAKLDLGWCDIMLLHHPGRGDATAYRAMEDYAGRGLFPFRRCSSSAPATGTTSSR